MIKKPRYLRWETINDCYIILHHQETDQGFNYWDVPFFLHEEGNFFYFEDSSAPNNIPIDMSQIQYEKHIKIFGEFTYT